MPLRGLQAFCCVGVLGAWHVFFSVKARVFSDIVTPPPPSDLGKLGGDCKMFDAFRAATLYLISATTR